MAFYPYEFETRIATHDVGSERYVYTVVFLPDALKRALPLDEHPRLRIIGEIEQYPFRASLTPVRGEWYVLLSQALLKAIDKAVGDPAALRFRIDDQDAVDVPDELQAALATNSAMRELWEAKTAGKQRALAYRVQSAKRPETRQRRIQEVFEILQGLRDERGRPIDPTTD